MISVFFIGSGRIAAHLAEAFAKTDIEVKGVHSKTPVNAKAFADKYKIQYFEEIHQIPLDVDVYFLAISDDHIENISNQLNVNGILVHCSGLKNMNIIQAEKNKAVFWPLQSFSKDRDINFHEIPILIEANSDENYRIIEAIADRISNHVVPCNSEQRQWYHLAAVFVNNFSNHLFNQAEHLISDQKLDFNLLLPLMKETVEKLKVLSPQKAQTGPALRGDSQTMKKHLDLLSENKTASEIYSLISISIQNMK